MVSAIVRSLQGGGEAENFVRGHREIVMEQSAPARDGRYVRFASSYRNFREAKDFEAVPRELSGDDEARLALCAK